MVMNRSRKFQKAFYNFFFVGGVTVKSLYTLRRWWQWRNEVKSTGYHPVDTNIKITVKIYSKHCQPNDCSFDIENHFLQ